MRNEKKAQLCRASYTDIKENFFTNTYTITKQRDILMCYKNLWKVTVRVYHSGIKRAPSTINKENEVQVLGRAISPKEISRNNQDQV